MTLLAQYLPRIEAVPVSGFRLGVRGGFEGQGSTVRAVRGGSRDRFEGQTGSRDRHLSSVEVSMIQYFTFSSNQGTVTLTLAARTAVSHRAPLIDSAAARKGSRDSHLNSAEVSMIQYFTFSSNRGTVTLTLAARTAVSHRAPLIDSAGVRKARHPEAKVFRSTAAAADRDPGSPPRLTR